MGKEWSPKKIITYSFFGIAAVFILLWIILFFGFDSSIKKEFRESGAFQASKEFVESDSTLISKIGSIVRVSDNIGGSYKPDSHAIFQFKVFGELGTIRVRCRLVFEQDKWIVQSLEH